MVTLAHYPGHLGWRKVRQAGRLAGREVGYAKHTLQTSDFKVAVMITQLLRQCTGEG